MKTKFFYSTFIILTIFCFKSNAQVYRTSWDNTTERQGWAQYQLGTDSFSSWFYTPVAVLSGEVLAHSAPSLSSTLLTDNWMVSPVFNFSSGGSIDSLIINLSGVGTPAMTDTLGIYLISGAHNPALSSSKQLLKLYTSADYIQNAGTYQNIPAINIPATPGNSYIAFRYKTVNGQFDAVFDALQVTANFKTSILNISNSGNDLKVYPNPGKGLFKIKLNEKLGAIEDVIIYDAKGSVIQNRFSNNEIDLSSLPMGNYFIRVKTSRAGVLVKQVVNY